MRYPKPEDWPTALTFKTQADAIKVLYGGTFWIEENQCWAVKRPGTGLVCLPDTVTDPLRFGSGRPIPYQEVLDALIRKGFYSTAGIFYQIFEPRGS